MLKLKKILKLIDKNIDVKIVLIYDYIIAIVCFILQFLFFEFLIKTRPALLLLIRIFLFRVMKILALTPILIGIFAKVNSKKKKIILVIALFIINTYITNFFLLLALNLASNSISMY